jgi:phosphoglycolate phosphatase
VSVASSGLQTVLFDLDGTLSHSESGILSSLRKAFSEIGVSPITALQERSLLGPPFRDSLPDFVGSERVDDVIAAYRRHYSAGGMYDAVLYDGIKDLLDQLAARGCTLAVATSKPENYAVPILQHLAIADRFAVICGDTPDDARGSKALVVAEALRRLGSPDRATAVMVGDRSHDVVGAHENGLRCIGAAWGYGGAEELRAAGAMTVVEDPAQLAVVLTSLIDGANP